MQADTKQDMLFVARVAAHCLRSSRRDVFDHGMRLLVGLQTIALYIETRRVCDILKALSHA